MFLQFSLPEQFEGGSGGREKGWSRVTCKQIMRVQIVWDHGFKSHGPGASGRAASLVENIEIVRIGWTKISFLVRIFYAP